MNEVLNELLKEAQNRLNQFLICENSKTWDLLFTEGYIQALEDAIERLGGKEVKERDEKVEK